MRQSRKIFLEEKTLPPIPSGNPGEELNHPIDLLIVHQGVIDPGRSGDAGEVIVFSFFPDIVAKIESSKRS